MSRHATGEIAENCGSGRNQDKEPTKRGQVSAKEWQVRARYVLRHLSDPIALQRSPLCCLQALEKRAEANYPHGVVARDGP